MKNAFRNFCLACALMANANISYACNPNEYEQCWRIELPFGNEAKDCKCLPKAGGDVADVVEGTVKPTVGAIIDETRKSPQAIANCIGNVGVCVRDVLAAPFSATIQLYIDGLYKQSTGRSSSFAPQFIAMAQPYYSVDLNGITFAQNINTGHGQTVAYCDRIFFAPASINLWGNYSDLRLVLHELEHTVQCQRRGKQTYLAEYLLKGGMDIIKSGQLNVHDMHDYEVAANAKADSIAPILWNQMRQGAARGSSTGGNYGSGGGHYGSGGNTGNTYPQQWLNFCQTPYGICAIPPSAGYRGAPCVCRTQTQEYPGVAY
jgi:hypothetical protein